MKQVLIHKLAPYFMREFYSSIDKQDRTAKVLLDQGSYVVVPMPGMEGTVEDIAEELFDLTNNPLRQDERVEKYGRGASLSVGDIVQVDREMVVCCSIGWKPL